MTPYLKWASPEGSEQNYELTADEILIGRKSDADIVLTNPYVSRQHAKLIKGQHGYSLLDLKSTHGTYINGSRIEKHELRGGDRICLGQDQVELLYFAGEAGTTTINFPSGVDDLEKSFNQLASILPAKHSDLEKISSILDFQYQWGKTFSAEKTFQHILQSALKISGAERGFVLLKQQDGFNYVVGMDGSGRMLSQSDFQTSRTVVRQVATEARPVFMSEGLAGEFAQQESILAMRLVAAACMPLQWISAQSDTPEVQGILYLDSTKTMHVLSGLDQRILNKLALEAGNVFEKLEVIKSLEERKTLEQELALAQETQKSLLPHSLPQLENFYLHAFNQPTRYVGGDFYDFMQLKNGQWVGVLADVSGKGISASLLSSLLQGALHMQCRSGAEPEETLNRVNQFLCEKTSAERFVTLFLFALNTTGSGQFINAGHNPAYLFRSCTGDIEELESGGLILGAFDFASYRSCPLQMRQGDVLVVYSDGVTEAQNPQGEMFGEKRLKKIIQEDAPAGGEVLEKKILQTIQEFTRGMAQTDDITFLLVEYV
jgi:sigma-B regulation protein RsbU (phosphoserine phosphatase)